MGSSFSTTSPCSADHRTTKVISVDGRLTEYSADMTAYIVLGPHYPSCILCSADSLDYNHHVSAMNSHDRLQHGQLCFILPASVLDLPLRGPDMVELALKATKALAGLPNKRGRRWVIQAMPAGQAAGDAELLMRSNEKSVGIKGLIPVHKKTRITPSRIKLARGTSGERLTAIAE